MSWLERIWTSRRTTAAFVVLYSAWVLCGIGVSYHHLFDSTATTRAVLHFQSTREGRIDVEGEAKRNCLRQFKRSTTLVGDSRIRIDVRHESRQDLGFVIEADGALPGDAIELTEEVTKGIRGARHALRDLQHWRLNVRLPLHAGQSTIHLHPTRDELRYRFYELTFERAAGSRDALSVTPVLQTPLELPHAKLRLGSGFWDSLHAVSLKPDQELFGRRSMHLLLEPHHPGPHRVEVAFRRIDPRYDDPLICVDGRKVTPQIRRDEHTGWSFASFVTELGQRTDLCLALAGPITSPRDAGVDPQDHRLVSFSLMPARLVVSPLP